MVLGSVEQPSNISFPEVKNVNSLPEESVSDSVSTGETEGNFRALFLKILGKSEQDRVNEEELYSALIEERLERLKPEAAEHYRTAKREELRNFTRSDGYTYVEKASLAALIRVVDAGLISETEGRQVNGEAFSAAQLDDNHELLFDGRGSGSDPTIALAEISAALFNLEQTLEKLNRGELTVDGRDLVDPQPNAFQVRRENRLEDSPPVTRPDEGSVGSRQNDTPDGSPVSPNEPPLVPPSDADDDVGVFSGVSEFFTWKPFSDRDGKPAVIIPSSLLRDSTTVETEDEEGERHTGRADGRTEHGNRGIYRFDAPGTDYGKEGRVVVTVNGGESLPFEVADPNQLSSISIEELEKLKREETNPP